jgi:hypothetical protein
MYRIKTESQQESSFGTWHGGETKKLRVETFGFAAMNRLAASRIIESDTVQLRLIRKVNIKSACEL